MGMPIINPGPGVLTKEKAIGDIIESIAMQELSLAHILNAESEKLQVIIGSANVTPEQIFLANNAVKDTVHSIARLEMQLHAKLELFRNVICK